MIHQMTTQNMTSMTIKDILLNSKIQNKQKEIL